MSKKEVKRDLGYFDIFSKNKKAQGLSTSTIILLILGVVILVILVLGFVLGWDKISPWIKQDNNVDTVKQTCQTACNMERRYDFCSNANIVLKADKSEYTATCYTYSVSGEFSKYGIEACGTLDCKPVVTCSDWTYLKKGQKEPVKVIITDSSGQDMTSSYCA